MRLASVEGKKYEYATVGKRNENDWLSLVRAIDVSASRSELVRDGRAGSLKSLVSLWTLQVGRRAFVTFVRIVKGDVDDLPMAKPVVQLNPRGSAWRQGSTRSSPFS